MSDPHAEFAAALAAFQAELPTVKKGQKATVKSDKGSYSYEYADLTDIAEVAMPVLARHGFSFLAAPTVTDHGFVLRYTLKHQAGHEEGGIFPLPDPARSTPQQIGSWLTYSRRYSLCAVTGIAPGGDDDDAVKATDARAADITRAPKRAERKGPEQVQAEPDPWASSGEPQRVTDAMWIDGFRQRIAAAQSDRELQTLQGEANHVWGEGKLSREDAQALRAEVSARVKELTGAPA